MRGTLVCSLSRSAPRSCSTSGKKGSSGPRVARKAPGLARKAPTSCAHVSPLRAPMAASGCRESGTAQPRAGRVSSTRPPSQPQPLIPSPRPVTPAPPHCQPMAPALLPPCALHC